MSHEFITPYERLNHDSGLKGEGSGFREVHLSKIQIQGKHYRNSGWGFDDDFLPFRYTNRRS